MKLKEPSLNVPFQKKDSWGLVLGAVSILAVGAAAIFDIALAITLAASCIVGMPAIYVLFFPPHFAASHLERTIIGRTGVIALLLAYFGASKILFVPFLSRMIWHILH
ncbi:hypothetical protein [Uliginosibacterium sediminicola]|uniref:Uncharacterized protein n=1 Tax=Uliginosibacterium sediminicola TaxID=2024550 RepID=A0ABU9Z0J3_9RHOO